jgi:hypothetical protein
MTRLQMTDPTPAASIYHDLDRDAFVFTVKNKEVLSLASNGEVRVYGRHCGDDEAVFQAVQRFLNVVITNLDQSSEPAQPSSPTPDS